MQHIDALLPSHVYNHSCYNLFMKKFVYITLVLLVVLSALYAWKISHVEIECEKEYSLGQPCIGG